MNQRDVEQLRAMAFATGGALVETPVATIVVIPKAPVMAASAGEPLLPLREAARTAATSPRVLLDAIRAGELQAFGKQRDRAVSPEDLRRWIETRRVRPVAGPVDADIDARVSRLARKRVGG